ncbi:MAG: gamma-glutamyl-gamma-aminobutyrate hydrolase family protein [Myxococcaceae bacterium]
MSENHRRPGGGGRRPTIGITPDISIPTPETPVPRYELRVPYVDAVTRAGGLPIILPYTDDSLCIESYLERISGLVITGGAFDIAPHLYGETPSEGLGPLKPERTAFETELLRGALRRNLPVLGICGGMQLLNIALGGTLVQDIRRELREARNHEQKHDRTQPQHPIDVKDGTLLAELLGRGQLMVNSTHHQSVRNTGQNVVVSAVAPDGVVEAIEARSYTFAVGVQWHPEMLIHTIPTHMGLYRGFVGKAREARR